MSDLPVTASQLLAAALASFIVIAIPGPSVLFVLGRALAYGQRVALSSVLGNTLGLFVVMTLVAVGLGAVVAESIVVFTVLKLAGAAYLVWLGVQAIRHRRAIHVDPDAVRAPLTRSVAIRQGFVVGVSNPKGFMIFAALLPQFVDRDRGAIPAQMFLLGMTAVVLGLVCDSVWAIAAARMRDWFNASDARGRGLGMTGGLSMIGLGVGIALTGRPD
ncbi:LysE family translocator [Nocardioides sp.]|uniref:LysE family translocator n=1 Tax=Nocardioides sp. TaxID=35761 RepID=UPI0035291A16